jgi:3',5'-cyclic-AMP phosphodiesterase
VVAGAGLCSTLRVFDVAAAAEPLRTFRLAYLSDTHLGDRSGGDRFIRAARKAVADINALKPRPDFVLFGGDLAEHGTSAELELGHRILGELAVPCKLVAGEHDWYLDLGQAWQQLFGPPSYSFDHKGVHVVALHSVAEDDFWTERRLSPEARFRAATELDGQLRGPFRVGEAQRAWLARDLAKVPVATPLLVFTHAPLYRYQPNWSFAVEDADQVQALLQPFAQVTVLHGHTHQLLCHRIGRIDFHGMLATAWPEPYPASGVPPLTVQMSRPNPFDPFDGCGDGQLVVQGDGRIDVLHNLWDRDPISITADYLSSQGRVDRPALPRLEAY